MTDREEAYMKKIQDLIDGVEQLTDDAVDRVLKILAAARKDVAARIAETEWDVHRIQTLKEAVQRAITGFAQRYGVELSAAETNLWNAGIDLVDWPLNYVGIGVSAPEISRTTLEILQGFSADLVSNVSADAVKAINSEITLGIMGQKKPFEVMKAIGRNLSDKGRFASIASRAETITRTEMARVHSAAREARIQAVVQSQPEVKWLKKWISSGKYHARKHHAALNGTTVGKDKMFPGKIPYPHAPGLPAKETINCGCSHVLTRSDWEELPDEWAPSEYTPRAIWD